MKVELLHSQRDTEGSRSVLTICIPAYSHEEYIQECIGSIASARSKRLLEVIVIDDCSSDSTVLSALTALSCAGVSYSIYRNEQNMGLTFGLDFLLSKASSEYVIFCASDDKLLPLAIDRVIADLSTEPIEAFTVYGAKYFGNKSGTVYSKRVFSAIFSDAEKLHEWVSTRIPKPLLLQSTVFNREFLCKISPWDDQLILDDWPTFIKASRQAILDKLKVSFSSEFLVEYRVHNGGIHRNVERQRRACFEVVDRLIAPEYAARARARVHLELSVVYLALGEYRMSLSNYAAAIKLNPTPTIIGLLPAQIVLGIKRFLIKKLVSNFFKFS